MRDWPTGIQQEGAAVSCSWDCPEDTHADDSERELFEYFIHNLFRYGQM